MSKDEETNGDQDDKRDEDVDHVDDRVLEDRYFDVYVVPSLDFEDIYFLLFLFVFYCFEVALFDSKDIWFSKVGGPWAESEHPRVITAFAVGVDEDAVVIWK